MRPASVLYPTLLTAVMVSIMIVLPAHAASNDPLTLERVLGLTMTRQAQIMQSELNREIAAGRLLAAGAPFDAQFNASVDYTDAHTPLSATQENSSGFSTQDSRQQNYTAGISKTLRSGLNLNSYLALNQSEDATNGSPDLNSRQLGVTLTIPFYDLVDNNAYSLREQAAQESLRSAVLTHYHQVASGLYQTTQAWWDFLAAQQRLKIYASSVERTQQSLRDYEKLIKAGERPKSDINQLEAKHVSMLMQHAAALKNFRAAGFQLARIIGVSYDQSEFTSLSGTWETISKKLGCEGLINLGQTQRFDLQAAQSSLNAAQLQLDAARRDEKSNLDLFFTVEGSQQAEQLWGNNSADNSGIKAVAGVQFKKWLKNSKAKGVIMEQLSHYHQAKIQFKELERTIKIDVMAAQDDLHRSMDTVLLAQRTVELYKTAYLVEQKKLAMGVNTMLDVIATFDSLRNALLSQVSTRAQTARAHATLKYASGEMLTVKNGTLVINCGNIE